jgi:predicted DCC family thiol-disulfide oxidoreductase YuxK
VRPIVLFDGACNLCNASVLFLIDRDPHARFRFAPLQSETGRRLLEKHRLTSPPVDSVVLIEGDRAWTESDAALRIARHLGGVWGVASLFKIVPRGLRDGLYRWVARHRYAWFGRQESCRLPTPELRARFLDELKPPS